MTAPYEPANIRPVFALARHLHRGDRDAVNALIDDTTHGAALVAVLLAVHDTAHRTGHSVEHLLDAWITTTTRQEAAHD